jgi:hypothetical protein
MAEQVAHRHHYVPETLLKPWLVSHSGQTVLQGYWWDSRHSALRCKRRGMDAFCNQLDLLSLRSHGLGRDAIERIFFGTVDHKGAQVRDKLLRDGVRAITIEERCHFARMLLSLEARRPKAVDMIRGIEGQIATGLNSDPEVLAAMRAAGLSGSPSRYFEDATGVSLSDRALLNVQKLVENADVGLRVVNARWDVVRFSHADGTLILSDRPLLRTHGYSHPSAITFLPLTPRVLFVAAAAPQSVAKLLSGPPHQLLRQINVASAQQAERYAFSVSALHERWLPKYLNAR